MARKKKKSIDREKIAAGVRLMLEGMGEDVTRDGLNTLGLRDVDPRNVQTLDSIDHMTDIQRVGRAFGEQRVQESHFADFL